MHAASIFKTTGFAPDRLPTVTADMLADFLSGHHVMAFPRASRRVVRWFNAGPQHDVPLPAGLRSGQILHVCRMREACRVLEEDGSAFVCALCPDDTLPPWVGAFAERLVVVQQTDTFSYFLFLVQRFFTDVMMWESELDRIVLRKGSLQELLNVGNSGLGDFMLCLDASYNVLAYTKGVEPPDNVYRNAVAAGCQPVGELPSDTVDGERSPAGNHPKILAKRAIQLVEATSAHPHPQLRSDVTVEGTRFATLILASTSDTISGGTRDLFAALVARIEPICESLWRDEVRI